MDTQGCKAFMPQQQEQSNMGNTSWGTWGLALSQQVLHAMVSSASLPWMRSQYSLTPPSTPTSSSNSSTNNSSSNSPCTSLSSTCTSSSASSIKMPTQPLCVQCAARANTDAVLQVSTPRKPHDDCASTLRTELSLDSSDACPSIVSSSTVTSPSKMWWRLWPRMSTDASSSDTVLCIICQQNPAAVSERPWSHRCIVVHDDAHQDVSSWLQQQDSRAVLADIQHATDRNHPFLLQARAGAGHIMRVAAQSAIITVVTCKLMPPGLVRGSSRRAAFVRAAACMAGWHWWHRDRHAHAKSQSTMSYPPSHSSESAVALLDLPHMTWLNEDFAQRLLAQTEQDVAAARQRAEHIHTWRQQLGLDRLVYPPYRPPHHQEPAAASTLECPKKHSRGWHLTRRTSSTHQSHQAGGAEVQHNADSKDVCLAATAAARYDAVANVVGCTLVYIDDTRGMAVLWQQGEALQRVKAGLCSQDLLGPAGARSLVKGQEPGWLTACAQQAAVMSDWIWRVRLRDQPVHVGRYVQVVDLKGLRLASALTEGLAVLRSIMSAGHNFPQRLAATIIINPPTGLTMVWNMIAQLLPHAVVAKIKIVRGGHAAILQELTRWMPMELIPATCGGKCELPFHQYPAQQELCKAMAAVKCLPQQQ